MELFGYMLIVCVALCIAVAARAYTLKSYGVRTPANAKESQAQKPDRDVTRSFLRRAGLFVQADEEGQEKTRLKLAQAGLALDPVTWRGIQAVAVLAGVILAFWLTLFLRFDEKGTLCTLGLGILGGVGGPLLFLASKKRERQKQLRNALPGALELLNTAVRAGYTIERGIRLVGSATRGPLASEFQRVDREVNLLSMPLDRALSRMKERCATPSINLFVNAMIQAYGQGTSVTRTLNAQAQSARSQHYTDLLVSINQLPNKMVPIIFVVFFPVIIALSVVPIVYNAVLQLSTIA